MTRRRRALRSASARRLPAPTRSSSRRPSTTPRCRPVEERDRLGVAPGRHERAPEQAGRGRRREYWHVRRRLGAGRAAEGPAATGARVIEGELPVRPRTHTVRRRWASRRRAPSPPRRVRLRPRRRDGPRARVGRRLSYCLSATRGREGDKLGSVDVVRSEHAHARVRAGAKRRRTRSAFDDGPLSDHRAGTDDPVVLPSTSTSSAPASTTKRSSPGFPRSMRVSPGPRRRRVIATPGLAISGKGSPGSGCGAGPATRPPTVCTNRTEPSPTSGSGWITGNSTAGNTT